MSINAVREYSQGGNITSQSQDRQAFEEIYSKLTDLTGVPATAFYLAFPRLSIQDYSEAKHIVDLYDQLTQSSRGGISSNVLVEMIQLIHSGSFIQAIKLYRQKTNVGLKEAKDFAEVLRDLINQSTSREEKGILSSPAFKAIENRISADQGTSYDEDRELVLAMMADKKVRESLFDRWESSSDLNQIRLAVSNTLTSGGLVRDDVRLIYKFISNLYGQSPKLLRRREIEEQIKQLQSELETI